METGDETQESRLSTILDLLITKAFHTELGNANNTKDRPECADAELLESLTLLKEHPRNADKIEIQSDSERENKVKKSEIKLTLPKVSPGGSTSVLGLEDKRRSKFPGLSSLLKLHWEAQKDRVEKQMREASGRVKENVDTHIIPFKIARRSGASKRTYSTMAANEEVDSEDGSSSLSHESDAASNGQESKCEEKEHESSFSDDESDIEFGSLVIDFENGDKSPGHSPVVKKPKVSHSSSASRRENDTENVYSEEENVEDSCNKRGNVKKTLRIALRKRKKNKDDVRNIEASDRDIRSLIVPTGIIIPNKNLCRQPPLIIKEVTNVSCNADRSGESTVTLNPLQTENNCETGTSQQNKTLLGIPATMVLNIDDNMRAAVLGGAKCIVAKLQIIPGLSNQITPVSTTVTSTNTTVTCIAEKLVGSASSVTLATPGSAFSNATSKTQVNLASKPDAQAIVSHHLPRAFTSVPVSSVNLQSLVSTSTVFSSNTPKTSISISQAILSPAVPLTKNMVNAEADIPIATTSSPSSPVTSVPVSATIPVPSVPWKHMVGCPMPAFPAFTSRSEGLDSKEPSKLASSVSVFPSSTAMEPKDPSSKETVGRQEGITTSPKPATRDSLKSIMKVKDGGLPNAVASNKETLKRDNLKPFGVNSVGHKQLPSKKYTNRKELVNKEKDEGKPDLLTNKEVEPVMNDKENKAISTVLKALSRPLARSIAEALSSPPLFSSTDLVPAREIDVQEHESYPQFMEKINRDGKDMVAWKCSLCNKMFSRNYTYKRHLATHMGDRPYVCKTCGKGFTDKRYLYKHMRWHTGDKLLFCNVCQRPFSDESGLKKHSRLHSGENMCHCETCGKMFSDKSTLRRHLLNVHQGVKPFKCGLCDLSFVFRSHLEDHMRRHTGEKPYQCQFCGRGFAQIGTRNRHEKGHSSWGIERKYMCLLCQQVFPHPSTLKKHYIECHEVDQLKSKTEGAVAEKFEDEDFEEVDINDIAKELKDEIDTVAKTYLKDSSNTDSSVDEHDTTTEEDDADNSGSDDCSSDDMDESSDEDCSQQKEEGQKPAVVKQEPVD